MSVKSSMFIKEIRDYDVEAKEAEIVVSDGQFEVMTYAWPFENTQSGKFRLNAFMTDQVMRATRKISFVEKSENGYFAYRLQGKIINVEKRIVSVGKIEIILEDCIPKDIRQNEYVEFTVTRVDFSG